MLEKILSPRDCADCRFCCSFRKVSMWETPLFTPENYRAMCKTPRENHERLECMENGLYRYNLEMDYATDDVDEEVACPFLDSKAGCALKDEEKPWDCKIWPLRVARKSNGEIWIVLTPTCSAVNKVPVKKLMKLVDSISNDLYRYVLRYPYLVKEYREDFFIPLKQLDKV